MPALLGLLWNKISLFVLWLLPWIIEKAFKVIGIGFVSYYGFTTMLNQVEIYIFAEFDNLGSDLYALLVMARIDDVLAVFFAAWAILFTHKVTTKLAFNNTATGANP